MWTNEKGESWGLCKANGLKATQQLGTHNYMNDILTFDVNLNSDLQNLLSKMILLVLTNSWVLPHHGVLPCCESVLKSEVRCWSLLTDADVSSSGSRRTLCTCGINSHRNIPRSSLRQRRKSSRSTSASSQVGGNDLFSLKKRTKDSTNRGITVITVIILSLQRHKCSVNALNEKPDEVGMKCCWKYKNRIIKVQLFNSYVKKKSANHTWPSWYVC